MTWVIEPGVKTALGVIGNITALGLFLAPVKTFVRILRARAVEDFSCLPYLVTFLNCALWTFYGLPVVTRSAVLVSTINGVGTALALTYCLIYLAYAPRPQQWRTGVLLAAEGLGLTLVVLVVLLALPFHVRSSAVGIIAVVVTIGMYCSPLGKMRQVVRDRSVEYMPFLLSLNVLLNATAWTVYAVYARDIYVLIPNALGVLLGTAQLVLYAWYCKERPAPVADTESGRGRASMQGEVSLHKNSSDVQLLARTLSIGEGGGVQGSENGKGLDSK